MTIEEKLKRLIISRYHSIREFARVIDMPNSTVDSVIKRGVENSSVINVVRICKELGISADALANGVIEPYRYETQQSTTVDVDDEVKRFKTKLSYADHVVIDGQEIDIEYVEPIIDALDVGYKISKKQSHKTITKTEKL